MNIAPLEVIITMRFRQPLPQTDSYMYSFSPSAIKIWNNLPQNVIDSDKPEQFK